MLMDPGCSVTTTVLETFSLDPTGDCFKKFVKIIDDLLILY